MSHPALVDTAVRLITPTEQAWLVRQQTEIVGQVGDLVSLIPLNGAAEVANTTGLKWPLTAETLHFGQARGISNRLTAEKATVMVQSGLLLCVHTRE
jgi:thiamine pyrophosphokinase